MQPLFVPFYYILSMNAVEKAAIPCRRIKKYGEGKMLARSIPHRMESQLARGKTVPLVSLDSLSDRGQ